MVFNVWYPKAVDTVPLDDSCNLKVIKLLDTLKKLLLMKDFVWSRLSEIHILLCDQTSVIDIRWYMHMCECMTPYTECPICLFSQKISFFVEDRRTQMGDTNERNSVQEKAEIALLHASGLCEWQTAEKFHCHYPNRQQPESILLVKFIRDFRGSAVFQTKSRLPKKFN